jgi:hypothetical protein
MNLQKAFQNICVPQSLRFHKYCHEKPIVMTLETYEKTRQLGLILHKAILYFVQHYDDYATVMPLSPKDHHILQICNAHPFRAGTYRTDFVIDEQNQIRIIEMTTRQPLNGYFISGFTNQLGQEKALALHLKSVINDYPRLLRCLEREIGTSERICIIKGNERLGDFKVYVSLFELAGIETHVMPLAELGTQRHLLENAFLIEELSHKEIRELPDEIINLLAKGQILNDFRNLFLIHDKRFFYILTHKPFLEKALSADERKLLGQFTIPTYLWPLHPEKFKEAQWNPEDWILKSTVFGKGEAIYAGCVTPADVWESLFTSGNFRQMVLQPFLHQKKFKGNIGEEQRDDFVAGTLLFFDDQYFGPGIYRASSFPVTNQGDDRKLAQVVAAAEPENIRAHWL